MAGGSLNDILQFLLILQEIFKSLKFLVMRTSLFLSFYLKEVKKKYCTFFIFSGRDFD